jgi:hypothetical protein
MDPLQTFLRAGTIAFVPAFAITLVALGTQGVPASEFQKRVPMTTVFYGMGPYEAPVRARDFVLTNADDKSLVARGLDKSGRPWRATLPQAVRGLWMTVRDDSRTYYFAGYTGGAGMAPDTWILALLFDDRGRPVPFFVRTRSAYDAKGITDLLNLDSTGPVLLQQTWLETNWNHEARSGYYVTTAYHQRGAYWYRTDGRHGSTKFPVFEKWAIIQDTRPEVVAPLELPGERLADYGNDPQSGTHAVILGVDDRGIHTSAELGCHLQSVDVVVKDSRVGREIEAVDFYAPEPGELLPAIARKRSPTIFTGLHRYPKGGNCTASIAWSTL